MPASRFHTILRRLVSQRPFQVFTVELHGGHRFEVDHPGAIAFGRGAAFFYVPGGVRVWFGHDTVALTIESTSDFTL
jgi:hypothetical protein